MRTRLSLRLRALPWACVAALFVSTAPAAAAPAGVAHLDARGRGGTAIVSFRDERALRSALAQVPARVVRRLPALRTAEVRPQGSLARFAARLSRLPGIASVQRVRTRRAAVEPALLPSPFSFGAYEWQYSATRSHSVPAEALRAAANVTIAVVDTGADLSAPDLAAKEPAAFDVRTRSADVSDLNGHGTFVSSLAAGSVSNGEGIAGFGGDARLLVIRTGTAEGVMSDVDAATAIVHAVEGGAKIINLSFGGPGTSEVERRAIDFAVSRGVLLVAAAGNAYEEGNPVIYPAAHLQPEGTAGRGGRGLAVAASTSAGDRAEFSSTGSYVSLAAPGQDVFAAVSSHSPEAAYPRIPLPGSLRGLYGFASGTSFAAPQVAGAAALVWGINPSLQAADVAQILRETADGDGWNPELGFGVLDVAGAVARAAGRPEVATEPDAVAAPESAAVLRASRTSGRAPLRIRLDASLRSSSADAVLASRELVLEAFDGRTWRPLARATTNAKGEAVWHRALRRGSHRLRVRYGGAADLAAATSSPVRLRAR
jgi:subtilisin family serine protease